MAASVMSDQIERDRKKKAEAERAQVESNDAQTNTKIAKLLSTAEELRMQKKIDRQLHNKDKTAVDLQAIVTAVDEERQLEAASANKAGDKSKENGAGLQMTVAGIVLEGENPGVMVSNWIKGVNSALTSTAKKNNKPKMAPSMPERALLDPPNKARKKLNVGIVEEEKREVKPLIFPF